MSRYYTVSGCILPLQRFLFQIEHTASEMNKPKTERYLLHSTHIKEDTVPSIAILSSRHLDSSREPHQHSRPATASSIFWATPLRHGPFSIKWLLLRGLVCCAVWRRRRGDSWLFGALQGCFHPSSPQVWCMPWTLEWKLEWAGMITVPTMLELCHVGEREQRSFSVQTLLTPK